MRNVWPSLGARAMGLRKEALSGSGNAAAGKDGKMTIASICSFLQASSAP